MKLSRRQLLKVGAFSGISMMGTRSEARRRLNSTDHELATYGAHHHSPQKLSKPIRIEGEIPGEINGELFRIAPGNKINFGDELNHFFDGDAFLTRIQIKDSQLRFDSDFLPTKKYLREKSEQKRLYSDFGTSVPGLYRPKKDAPSINIIPYNGNLLALSDTSLPSLIDLDDFTVQDLYNFEGQMPNNMTFNAHPKYDIASKKYIGIGLKKSLGKKLVLFTLDEATQRVNILNEINLEIFPLIHDFLITENFIVLIIPPIEFSIWDMVLNQNNYAQSVRTRDDLNTQMILCRKDSGKEVSRIDLPHFFSFHHVNAYEEGSNIVFDSIISEDSRIFDYLNEWNQKDRPRSTSETYLQRFEVNTESRTIHTHSYNLKNIEFPSLNLNNIGRSLNYCYLNQSTLPEEPLAFNKIVKVNMKNQKVQTYRFSEDQVCGEALFIEKGQSLIEDDGNLVSMVYDHQEKESFLEFIDARTLSQKARVWLGKSLPIGFHGCFIHRN